MNSFFRFVLRIPRILQAILEYLWALVQSNVQVAWEVATPGLHISPAIIRVPNNTRTDLETMLLANMITMTPGTLTLEVDRRTRDLYVHTLYYTDHESFLADIAKLERTLLKATR
ncbi:MAG TPA: Na+/H+ antiporter subunit E [Egicoccus sp.]|nr:Na+/H+ antiporter subunit E [Egicoccus sp.]HSK22612.1 Na+/H+ antiporter subunit E [Egicoccus sp.]